MGAININATNVNAQYNRQKPDVKIDFSSLAFDKFVQSSGMVGMLLPVFWREVLPTQSFNIKQRAAVQFTPFVTNMFTPFEGRVMSYFVPSRLIWEDLWEKFITTGQDGVKFDDKGEIVIDEPLPKLSADMFDPFFQDTKLAFRPNTEDGLEGTKGLVHSLYDLFGLPMHTLPRGKTKADLSAFLDKMGAKGRLPITALFRAYNLIWNEVLRFPDISVTKRNLDDMTMQRWYWANDYFTRARIYQQRGDVPIIPLLSASGAADEIEVRFRSYVSDGVAGVGDMSLLGQDITQPVSGSDTPFNIYSNDVWGGPENYKDKGRFLSFFNSQFSEKPYSSVTASLAEGAGISLNDFRMALAIGNFEIDMAKVIPRYINYITDIWHGDQLDARFQLPEFISTWTFGVDFSSVVQTSGENRNSVAQGDVTALGHISSLASAVSGGDVSFKAPEHGYIISLMCIRPFATYDGGLSRFLIRNTPFDFATPHLVNVPDVQIESTELLWDVKSLDGKHGWMGIYDEYRSETGSVTGLLRPSISDNAEVAGLGSMTLARWFENTPYLNEEFCICKPDMARIKVFPFEPDFTMFFTSSVHTAIPIPFESNPTALGTM